MTAAADPGRATAAVLTFAGGLPPVRLDGAVLHSCPSGTTTLSGSARPDALEPGRELCLPLAEYGGRRWSVADVQVEVARTGDHHDRVTVSWHSGHELEAVDPGGRYRVEVAWLLRARTLKLLPLDDLVDGHLAPYAVALASGLRDPRVARRLELACNEVASRDPLVTPRLSRRSAETGPLRLLHDVTAAGGHLAATTGTVRARAESRDRLAALSLVTVPRKMPAAPDAPVLVVNEAAPTMDMLRACESMAAEEHRGIRLSEAATQPAAAGEGAFEAAREALHRRYARPLPHRRRPTTPGP
ncbi:hypothetical protein [Streptomyces sp. NBC_01205]|uniref:hypothetical protein n=1 Tax=Streptomyces sp. NBC_01205 TaxID=2903771 RepID=UPI002E111A6E|nr:hypothetical protein OG573_31190 [Streptomyces sp. NBC_01205]